MKQKIPVQSIQSLHCLNLKELLRKALLSPPNSNDDSSKASLNLLHLLSTADTSSCTTTSNDQLWPLVLHHLKSTQPTDYQQKSLHFLIKAGQGEKIDSLFLRELLLHHLLFDQSKQGYQRLEG
jgi:hypothetical protein